jgi:hypothetical protein
MIGLLIVIILVFIGIKITTLKKMEIVKTRQQNIATVLMLNDYPFPDNKKRPQNNNEEIDYHAQNQNISKLGKQLCPTSFVIDN